jgi:WD40 repeat protein
VAVWDLASGAPIGQPFTGHTGAVTAIATAQLDGRPVIVSGDGGWNDSSRLDEAGAIRVRDLTTGAPIGQPLTLRSVDPLTDRTVATAIAIAQLDGRPVIVSGSGDGAVQVWDLASGAPIGQPLIDRSVDPLAARTVNAIAIAQLDGRPVILSGDGGGGVEDSADGTIRVWDLATGAPIGQPVTGPFDGTTGLLGSPPGDAEVGALAVAQLDGRSVIVAGSGDATVRVWDLATRAPIGRPLTGPAT